MTSYRSQARVKDSDVETFAQVANRIGRRARKSTRRSSAAKDNMRVTISTTLKRSKPQEAKISFEVSGGKKRLN
ncbi:MAG: hypothetical protein DMF68_10720 [Acidobacteria bacterium]|nr:MAG: hypothetical protein DMF68_10720 [Acidobacteriota bacterium]